MESKSLNTCKEKADTDQQLVERDPEFQNTPTGQTQKTSSVKLFDTDQLPSAASGKTEQQNLLRLNQKAENVPKQSGYSEGKGYHSVSQTLSTGECSSYMSHCVFCISTIDLIFCMAITGERSQSHSNLSAYLTVKGYKSVIGGCVCPPSKPFFTPVISCHITKAYSMFKTLRPPQV